MYVYTSCLSYNLSVSELFHSSCGAEVEGRSLRYCVRAMQRVVVSALMKYVVVEASKEERGFQKLVSGQ